MAEYIDRDNFLKKLGEVYPGIPPHGAIIVGMLCDEKPADVRPVVRSRWQISCDGWYPYCPACGAEPPGREMTPFCSMCGADMREEAQTDGP